MISSTFEHLIRDAFGSAQREDPLGLGSASVYNHAVKDGDYFKIKLGTAVALMKVANDVDDPEDTTLEDLARKVLNANNLPDINDIITKGAIEVKKHKP